METLVDQLNRDLKKTVLSQRETGASANEVLLQLETEIEGYYFMLLIIVLLLTMCRLRKSMTDKDSEIQRLKDNMKSLENKATVAESEVKAYTSVIDSQKVKISQLEMEREKDVLCFLLGTLVRNLTNVEIQPSRNQVQVF